MVSEVGLAAAMRPKTEFTILAPVNNAFSSELFSKQKLSGLKLYFVLADIKYIRSCSFFEVMFLCEKKFKASMFVCVR